MGVVAVHEERSPARDPRRARPSGLEHDARDGDRGRDGQRYGDEDTEVEMQERHEARWVGPFDPARRTYSASQRAATTAPTTPPVMAKATRSATASTLRSCELRRGELFPWANVPLG